MPGTYVASKKSRAEYVCLECELPECNEKNPKCMYRQLKLKRASQSKAKGHTCPHPTCAKVLTDNARTCVHHRWFK